MSSINFFESADIPQPKDKIKIEKVEAQPYPDGWRVRVVIDVTPFQERPNLEIRVKNAVGRDVSQLSVIETMHRHMEFTVHIRGVQSPIGDYTTEVDLYYGEERTTPQDHHATKFSVEAK